MLEKTLESPLDFKKIQSVHPKGDQSRVFMGRSDVEVETPILWPPDAKNSLSLSLSLSLVAKSCLTLVTPWTVTCQAPLPWDSPGKNTRVGCHFLGKDPDAGKDWRQEEKGTTEDEMIAWHHRLNGDEFEQAPGAGEGQGCLACCSPWGCKESDTTERLNWTELIEDKMMSIH